MKPPREASAAMAAIAMAIAGCCFVLAAAAFPGGGYNPCMRMLSALGRTEVRMVTYPWSCFLFAGGMLAAAMGVIIVAWQRALSRLGAALNAIGLVAIAVMPENLGMLRHNAGCWLAAIGGGLMLIRWFRAESARRVRCFWAALLVSSITVLGAGLVLSALRVVPFAPWVPTAQKAVILSFAAWMFFIVIRPCALAVRCRAGAVVALPVVLAFAVFVRFGPSFAETALAAETEADATPAKVLPLSAGELEDLAWLEYVTGTLTADEEVVWWGRARPQYSIFSKRYNIAFAGYAAAALGQRGDGVVRARVGRILGRCIERMLEPGVWGYSQSKSYWGLKPWAPDPCYRENVMYTGHLLQLLAYYELFTGDARYHRAGGGWDFVWKDGRRVHYDVEKLIAVTVEQMRKGPNGGISCEPGLMFFACNNHPHVALAVFKALGYGDWSADARRWERWALERLVRPAFGGGSLGLVYHMKSNIVYPRGQNAFDGWSLLWYEAWASDRRLAKALWREASASINCEAVGAAADRCDGRSCCDPEPAPPSIAAVFLAAAARACGDPETAARFEATVDGLYERRDGGRRWLELNPEWRIGATAMRIASRAMAGGSSFRTLTRLASLRPKGQNQTKGKTK